MTTTAPLDRPIEPTSVSAGRQKMTVIVQDEYGPAPEDVLRLDEIDKPTIAENEVLVRVHAASVDRGTWHVMAGLREPTADVLAKFRAGGTSLVLLWWGFALTAVPMVPLVVLLSSAISDADPTLIAIATTVGVLAAGVQFLALIRWPFLVPLRYA